MRLFHAFPCAALVVVACSSTGSSTQSTSTSGTGTTTSTASSGGGGATTSGSGGHGGQADTGGSMTTTGTGGAGTGGSTTTTTGTGGTGGGATCPTPGTPDCSPGDGTGAADQCFDAPPCFLKIVQDAVKYVINTEHPEWIDWGDGNPRVLDANQNDYVLAVVDRVIAQGLCAIQDPNAGDEIVVKFDNTFAENFDILASTGYARYGNGIFTATCAPAWF